MTVLAHYSDGTTRDVTPLTVFQSSNDVSAAVDEKGLVTAGPRGEAFMMARFNIFTVGVPMVVIPEDLEYQRPKLPANNYVDTHVHNKLHKLRMTPSVYAATKFLSDASTSISPDSCQLSKNQRPF